MLSTLDLLLRFHFIFQPCCNSRKQAHRFIPDQIDRDWLNTAIHLSESQASKVSESMTLCTRCPNKFWTGIEQKFLNLKKGEKSRESLFTFR